MSKYVKNLIAEELRHRLQGVDEVLLVNTIGLDATTDTRLRAELRGKDIHVVVVKNSMAARATEGTPLAAAFEGLTGASAVCWGTSDFVGLAKEITRIARLPLYKAFQVRGGAMDGEKLSPRQVEDVARWPSREEQLGLLVGQILRPGGQLAAQLLGAGGVLASQIKEKGSGEEEAAGEGPAPQGENEGGGPSAAATQGTAAEGPAAQPG
jgi:ribosomal protein L10